MHTFLGVHIINNKAGAEAGPDGLKSECLLSLSMCNVCTLVWLLFIYKSKMKTVCHWIYELMMKWSI